MKRAPGPFYAPLIMKEVDIRQCWRSIYVGLLLDTRIPFGGEGAPRYLA